MANDNNGSVGLAWFLAGLGAGAVMGILYAPKSGRETREELLTNAREGGEYLRTRSRDAMDQMNEAVEKGRGHMHGYADRSREAMGRGRAQWEEFVERGKNIVHEHSDRVAAAVEAGRQAYKDSVSSDGETIPVVDPQ